MTLICIIIPTICYTLVAVGNFRQKDYPHALVWLSYSLANVGFLWYELTKEIK